MELVLDIGNSFVKAGLFEGDELKRVERFETANDLKAFVAREKVEGGIFASVIALSASLRHYLVRDLGLAELSAETHLPVQLAYATPETLGIDRIAASVASYQMYPDRSSLAIETGTCLTYDLVTADGVYQGGAISPGFQMRFKAMNAFTGQLPLVAIGNQEPLVLTGTDTRSSLISGVLNGLIHEVDGFINDYRQKHPDLAVVLGGGDTAFFEKHLKNPIFAQPNLVLIGLHEILKCNASS